MAKLTTFHNIRQEFLQTFFIPAVIIYITIKNDNTPLEKPSKYELNKKIDNIFKSNDYIYKIKVNITLKDKEIICTLIGKTNNNLITIDNKLINIKDIIDIKKVD